MTADDGTECFLCDYAGCSVAWTMTVTVPSTWKSSRKGNEIMIDTGSAFDPS